MLRLLFLLILFVATILVWSVPSRGALSVTFFDVGQGDSIFIESPTGVQMLIDGGADSSVLRGLGEKMSFSDRAIDIVVGTHPDKDHIGGLVDVFQRYEVNTFVDSGVGNETSATESLVSAVLSEKSNVVFARRGMRFLLGGGAFADILFPDRALPAIETNTGSIIMRVVYGDTEFMLSGDSPSSIEKYVVALGEENLHSDVLKAGHHGSKTSSAEEFVKAVSPQYVVYSRGCDNTYGHPAPEVVSLFQKLKIPTLDTCEDGTITFESNGKTLQITER